MNKVLLAGLAAIAGWYLFVGEDQVVLGPGVFAPDPPQQSGRISSAHFMFEDYRITPLAEFSIKAKILSKKDYSFGRESDLSPTDLALGWGRMSDENVLDVLDISQGGRWYRWQAQTLPIPVREIETHSANMHLVPADRGIELAIERARAGDLVAFSGQLIRADAKDGWHWVSSLRRDDTGGSACELIWVDQFEVQSP